MPNETILQLSDVLNTGSYDFSANIVKKRILKKKTIKSKVTNANNYWFNVGRKIKITKDLAKHGLFPEKEYDDSWTTQLRICVHGYDLTPHGLFTVQLMEEQQLTEQAL